MKCENCSHVEMCRWIDELEGRGCDFYDDKPCELLILKSDILLHQDDRKKWAESIKREKESGVIILPPYFEPLLVPNDIEINIEQEPCDDAISRILKKMWNCRGKHTTSIDKVAMEQIIRDELSVTQSRHKGHWLRVTTVNPKEFCNRCSECGYEQFYAERYNYCPNCGCRMVEPQERSE